MIADGIRQLWDSDACWWCQRPVAVEKGKPQEWPYWTYWTTYYRRRQAFMQFYPVCATCFEMDKEIDRAKLDSIRFTEISVSERHHCGRTLHATTGTCLMCARELRMVDRSIAEIRIARRMANQLLRECRQKVAA